MQPRQRCALAPVIPTQYNPVIPTQYNPVIPAKAGIYGGKGLDPRLRSELVPVIPANWFLSFPRRRESMAAKGWIPAFAGMTVRARAGMTVRARARMTVRGRG